MQLTTLKAKKSLLYNGVIYKPNDIITQEITLKDLSDDDYEGIPELSEKTKIALKNWQESRKHLKKIRHRKDRE